MYQWEFASNKDHKSIGDALSGANFKQSPLELVQIKIITKGYRLINAHTI